MSIPSRETIQRLAPDEEGDEEYLQDDDILEVEELEIDGMEEDYSEGEDEEYGEEDGGMQDGEDDGGEPKDGTEDLMQSGFDDTTIFFTGHGRDNAVFCIAVHPTESGVVVSGGEDECGRIWKADTGEEVAKLDGHTDSVTSVGWSWDGGMVATGGMDGKVLVWKKSSGAEGKWEKIAELEGPDEVNWLDWHPKGNLLLAGGADGTVWLWSLPTGNTLHVLTGHVASVTCGRFTPDGKKIVTCSEDSALILWDPRTGLPIHKLVSADARFSLSGGINSLAINPASTVAIAGGAEGGLRAVNLVQGSVLAQMLGHEDGASIEAVGFSEVPTAGQAAITVVVSVGTDARVCTWEANTFKLRSTGLHEDAVTSLGFAGTGKGATTFVTGSADKTLKVWDYRRGTCVKTVIGHRDVVHCCAVSQDGAWIVSGGDDGARSFSTNKEPESEEVKMETA